MQVVFHLHQPCESSVVIRVSGMPVILETTSAITSSSTTPSASRDFAPVAGDGLLLLLELVGLIAQGGGLLEILVGDRLFLFLVQLFDFVVDLLEIGRRGHGLEPHAAPASSITSIALSGRQRP